MKTILIVEDDSDFRELLSTVIRGAGYAVCEAENGQDALQQLVAMREPPCLLLLDLMMPVMSGLELLQALNERNRLDSLTIVILSAADKPSQSVGTAKFIGKPVDAKRVLTLIHEVCGEPDPVR